MTNENTPPEAFIGDLSDDEQALLHALNDRARELWEQDGIVSDAITAIPIMCALIEVSHPDWDEYKKIKTAAKVLDFLNDLLLLNAADAGPMQ